MNRLFALLATLMGLASAQAAPVADLPWAAWCDAPESSTVLWPAPEAARQAGASEARAVWLDRRLIRWPGADAQGRFRLVRSLRAQLVATPGELLRGADASVPLALHEGPVPADLAERFKWLGAGPVLALPPSQVGWLPLLLRQQLMLVQEDGYGRVLRATHLQLPGALDDLYADAERLPDLGVTVAGGSTAFRLWAPTAQRVSVCLHPDGSARATTRVAMERDAATGSWMLRIGADLSGRSYTYMVEVPVPGVGVVRYRVTDPYSVSLSADSRRSHIASLDAPALKPPGWDADAAPRRVASATDMVVYELHVRDFSIGDASVSPARRGKYAAFTETGSDGMKHLKALADAGLTDVHLLPVFDLASVPEVGCATPRPAGAPDGESQQAAVRAVAATDCFNWGYDPWHFNAPEGSFASDAADGARRVIEFRQMVMALHAAGLRVGMDVVYNHTAAAGGHEKSVLDRVVPGYYHRLNAVGAVERSTCCDNTATEHRMMGKLMVDSAVLWARHYGIDSFRFDLMGHQPRAVMEQLQARVNAATGRSVQLLGEGWNFGEVADGKRFVQASQRSLNGSGIGTFSDRARDAVRGGGAADNGAAQIARQGYINGLHYDPNALAAGQTTPADLLRAADLVRVGLAGTLRDYVMTNARDELVPLSRVDYAGQPAGYASQPGEVVNYVENHDNQTLFDANVFKLPAGTSREDRARVQHLGSAIVAFSQGIAYFHAGQELLRSKSMDRNSYDAGDWFNRIDWTLNDNFFGTGLPPQPDNGPSWPLMKPLLADPSIKPTAAEMRWTRDAFVDLLKIRASSALFRLRSADEVKGRLLFHNTGSVQVPTVLVGHLDGVGLPGAGFRELVYLVNVDKVAQSVTVEPLKDLPLELHPVHQAPGAADRRAASARFDPASGRFNVPARTAVVFVVR
jgi:pullulanase